MNIEIKISKKPVDYKKAVIFMEKRLDKIREGKARELIWILEHNDIYTAGSRSKKSEILDKKIKVIKTNRGGKITWHGKGQLICYFVINLNKRNKDIRKFITNIEKSIINTLKEFKIKSFSDRQDIGIWIKIEGNIKKIAAIGIRVKKWIAYHGFSININNDLKKYNKIIPCGIKNKAVTNLENVKKNKFTNLKKILLKNLIKNL
tara:strand:+ start:811 stop:1425 length:615 start_codon:yes stop_codon:yes gene_type:complete